MLPSIGLAGVAPATPRLNEPISRSFLNRCCAPTGVTPAGGAGEPPGGGSAPATSVASSVPGGGTTSTTLLLHLPPPWQVWQPALKNSARPASTSALIRPPVVLLPSTASSWVVSGRLGVRTPKRIHSFMASSAGQAGWLAGGVTVSCLRPVLASAKLLITDGAALMSPVSLISRP